MRKSHLLAILVFSAAWGLSESVLGDALYTRQVPFASVGLTTIAFLLLAMARPFLPRWGGATAIGLLAMLYKFLNVPFFACHLSAIALLGVSWDLAFGLAGRGRLFPTASASPSSGALRPSWLRESAVAAAAVYASYLLFVLAMVFVFRSEHWITKGLAGAARHVFVSGSLAALACAVVTPLGMRLGERLRGRAAVPMVLGLEPRFSAALASVVAIGLWAYGVAGKMMRG